MGRPLNSSNSGSRLDRLLRSRGYLLEDIIYKLKANINKFTLDPVQTKAWLKNLLRFTAPALAIFFAQLALGVDWKAAGLVALYSLYALISDYLKKLNS